MAPIIGGERHLSLAGWWRLLVSQPLLLVVWGAWLWRIAVWAHFLWQVARLDLRLVPVHPDLAGGLGFVATSMQGFSPVAFALGASTAGGIAEGVLLEGHAAGVQPAADEGASPRSVRLRRAGGGAGPAVRAALAGARPRAERGCPGAPDFSATTDLYSIAANVRNMRLVPFDLRGLIPLLASALPPQVLQFAKKLIL